MIVCPFVVIGDNGNLAKEWGSPGESKYFSFGRIDSDNELIVLEVLVVLYFDGDTAVGIFLHSIGCDLVRIRYGDHLRKVDLIPKCQISWL